MSIMVKLLQLLPLLKLRPLKISLLLALMIKLIVPLKKNRAVSPFPPLTWSMKLLSVIMLISIAPATLIMLKT